MQALGQRVGSHRAVSGCAGSGVVTRLRQSAVAGSKKQSASGPTWKVRATLASMTRRRARSAIMAADVVLVPVQPSPYDIWAADEVVKLIVEASVFKESLKATFVVNRKVAKTAIGRDVVEALAAYQIPTMTAQIVQRVVFAEAAATGRAVFEIDGKSAAAAEIEAVRAELMELVA